MKTYSLIMVIALLVGCYKPMTNEQIIAEINKCTNANLIPSRWGDWAGRTVFIECQYRGEK